MAGFSDIEWTDKSWNPGKLHGCVKISDGCLNCYTEPIINRFDGPGMFNVTTYDPAHPSLLEPLGWKTPYKIFVNSMSDLFQDEVDKDFIAQVFAVMALASRHTFQVLTKRHGRLRSLLRSEHFQHLVRVHALRLVAQLGRPASDLRFGWPLRNVWVGVSAENQHWADIRIPVLLDTPAALHWISVEPQLGPVDPTRVRGHINALDSLATGGENDLGFIPGPSLGWVVYGGESGPGARPPHPQWFRDLRDQTERHNVAGFFKQWGAWSPEPAGDSFGGQDWARRPWRHALVDPRTGEAKSVAELTGAEVGHARMYRVGKKTAGKLLDGQIIQRFPELVPV